MKGVSGNPTGIKGRNISPKNPGLKKVKTQPQVSWGFVNWNDLEAVPLEQYEPPPPPPKPTATARIRMRFYDAQDGKCAGCDIEFTLLSPSDVVLDHCHVTGEFRGLLCQGCNKALGFIKDSPDTARRLATYLEHSR